MKEVVVLDTSVLLSDCNALYAFPNRTVIVTATVINELDEKKTKSDEVGKNAREVIRTLERLRQNGNLHKGVKIPEINSVIEFVPDKTPTRGKIEVLCNDHKIINTALWLQQKKNTNVTVISQDLALRLMSETYGLATGEYTEAKTKLQNDDEFYSGFVEIDVLPEILSRFYSNRKIQAEEIEPKLTKKLYPNEFVCFRSLANPKDTGIGIHRKNGMIERFTEIKKIDDLKPRNREQQLALQLLMDKNIHLVTLIGTAGTGKAQPLDAKVLTPKGWSTMGAISKGHEIIGSDGKPKKVLQVFPQGEKDIYRVSFDDGSSTECCKEHLWFTKVSEADSTLDQYGSVKTMEQIMADLPSSLKPKRTHHIPIISGPAEFFAAETPADAYSVGFLLADKDLRNAVSMPVNDVVSRLRHLCLNTLQTRCDVAAIRGALAAGENEVVSLLQSMGVAYMDTSEQFIPDEYKFNSIDVRIGVIHGLMDSRGTLNRAKDYVRYKCDSKRLCNDIQFVVQSLGGTALIHEKKTKGGPSTYTVTLRLPTTQSPFRYVAKGQYFWNKNNVDQYRAISKIEYVGRKEAKCILIDSDDHLYVTDDFILTHNTLIALASALKQIEEGKYDRLFVTKPMIPAGQELGFFPGDKQAKLDPWMGSIYDNLRYLLGSDHLIDELMANGKLEIEALSLLRGRNIPRSIILVDEAQNCTQDQIKMVVTRAAMDSKFILTGDTSQIDNKHVNPVTNGATNCVEKVKGEEITGHVTLEKCERSPLAEMAARLL